MSRARAAKAFAGLLCALLLIELTFGISPASRASAVEPGDPTAQDGFGAGVVAWTATDMGGTRWVTATDTSNPSPEKKVLTNTDTQTGVHAAHWTGVALGGPFRAEAKIKGPVGGTDNWVGIAFRYNPATGAYLVARYRAGSDRVQLVRYPEGEVLAEGTLTAPPPGCAAAAPAQVPAGGYFTGKVEQDGSGLVRVYFEGSQVLSATVPASEAAGGFAGVYYEGAAGAFDDFTLQGPQISADPHVSVSVDASQPGETAPEGFFGAMLVWLALTNGLDAYFGDWDELRDNLAALETVYPLISEMGVKSLRFPGGLVSNEYDWKLHIGDFYGDKNDPRHPNGLSLDEFMQMAENLGAKPVFTVNASDPGWGWGPIVGAQEAADLVEYLTIPYDGSNPDPDGLSPTDPDNIDWAKRRADDGRIEPYKILGFEIGNELRGPPYLLQTPPAIAYANRLVGFASAMKAVNPNIKIGAVGADVPGRADYAPWYETVYNAISTSNCDLRPLDGIPAPCADFWIKHILGPGLNVTTPGSQGFGYDGQGAVVERSFTAPVAGSYKIALSAHTSGISGPYPLLQMQIDGGAALDYVFDIRNNGVETHPAWTAMHLYRSPAFNLSAGTHTIRFTRQNNGIGATNRRLLLYPTVHLERASDPASYTRIDLKDTEVLSRLLQSTATSNARFVMDPSPTPGGTIYGLPLWITELYFAYEQYDPPISGQEALQYAAPMDPTVDDLREALAEANLYADFWNQGVQQVSSLLLFDEERGAGLVEGVALDIRHGDQTLLDRYGTSNPPRLRPRGMMLAEMTRHWKGRKLPTSTAGPTYDVLGNTLDGFSIGSAGFAALPAVPYVTAVGTLDATGNRLYLTLINTHLTQALPAEVTLTGFTPGAQITQTVVGGAGPWANNEPESDICSHPAAAPSEPCKYGVEPRRTTLFASGSTVSVALPPSSAVFLSIPKASTDQTPPPKPVNLSASPSADGTGVQLAWGWGGGEFVTYNVYRSLHIEPGDPSTEDPSDTVATPCKGPWANKLNAAPFAQTGLVDRKIDGGAVYCYGVRAVDIAGNQSEMTTVRHRATTQVRPLADVLDYNPTINPILFGTALANVNEDAVGTPTSDFLILRPRYSGIFPTNDLDFSISSAPYAGDPARLKSLRVIYASRFKTPAGTAQASLYLKNYAAGGVWEKAKTFQQSTNYAKDQLLIRRADPEDYLSPEGRVTLRIATNEGGAFQEFHLEQVRFELETL